MAVGPTQHPATSSAIPDGAWLRMARQHRAALLRDIHLFEQSIAAPVGAPDWRHRVSSRLIGLRSAFAEHALVTEGPDGLYAELLADAPRLARGVHVLIREHAVITAALEALQRRAALPETTAEELRGWASDLLREMSRHRQRGADLVYQAYQTDIGGET